MIPAGYYLTLAALLFTVGAIGVVIRRNVIVVFMCIEMMLNAVNLTFAAFSAQLGNLHGQISAFFVIVVAAGEAAVGLAITLSLFRAVRTVESSDADNLFG